MKLYFKICLTVFMLVAELMICPALISARSNEEVILGVVIIMLSIPLYYYMYNNEIKKLMRGM